MSDDSGFLARWSRRKNDARQNETPLPEEPTAAPKDAGVLPERSSDPSTRADLGPADTTAEEAPPDLPPVEALTAASDFSAFLRPGVPDALRIAALRRLWVIDPEIRNFVGPARDYAWDWNVPGDVPGAGPLLPIDDIQKLVARVFGDPESEAPPADAPSIGHGPGEADRVEMVQQGAGTNARSHDDDAAPTASSQTREDAPQQNSSLNVAPHREARSTSGAEERPGRHGGAVPK
jgi:hypothetical protein